MALFGEDLVVWPCWRKNSIMDEPWSFKTWCHSQCPHALPHLSLSALCSRLKMCTFNVLLLPLCLMLATMLPLHDGHHSFEAVSTNKPFLLQVDLVMVFYLSKKKLNNTEVYVQHDHFLTHWLFSYSFYPMPLSSWYKVCLHLFCTCRNKVYHLIMPVIKCTNPKLC